MTSTHDQETATAPCSSVTLVPRVSSTPAEELVSSTVFSPAAQAVTVTVRSTADPGSTSSSVVLVVRGNRPSGPVVQRVKDEYRRRLDEITDPDVQEEFLAETKRGYELAGELFAALDR